MHRKKKKKLLQKTTKNEFNMKKSVFFLVYRYITCEDGKSYTIFLRQAMEGSNHNRKFYRILDEELIQSPN